MTTVACLPAELRRLKIKRTRFDKCSFDFFRHTRAWGRSTEQGLIPFSIFSMLQHLRPLIRSPSLTPTPLLIQARCCPLLAGPTPLCFIFGAAFCDSAAASDRFCPDSDKRVGLGDRPFLAMLRVQRPRSLAWYDGGSLERHNRAALIRRRAEFP